MQHGPAPPQGTIGWSQQAPSGVNDNGSSVAEAGGTVGLDVVGLAVVGFSVCGGIKAQRYVSLLQLREQHCSCAVQRRRLLKQVPIGGESTVHSGTRLPS